MATYNAISEEYKTPTDEEKWRDVIGVWIKINGTRYNEVFNRSIGINLNLIIYLIKYLKKRGTIAEKEIYYGMFALYKAKEKALI